MMDVEESLIEIKTIWEKQCQFDVNILLTHNLIWPKFVIGTAEGNVRIYSNQNV
jgi:hypothetical protein